MLAAHRFDVLRTSINPKMVQIHFQNHIKEADIYKSIRYPLIHSEGMIIDYICLGIGKFIYTI